MKSKDKHTLQCIDVARAAFGEPAKAWGQQPEPEEAYFACSQHSDEHPSLKVSHKKNSWMCGPCGAGGNAWELAAFHLGKGCKWEVLSKADQKEVTDWLREHGLLPEASKRSRKAAKPIYQILREHIYRDFEGDPVAKRVRYDAPANDKGGRFRWFHSEITTEGAGEGIEWKAGCENVKALTLYIGVPAPGGKEIFLRCLKKLADSSEIIFCEGEHDADAGAQIGLVAVTSGGTSSLEILRNNLSDFRDKNVVILAHPGAEEGVFAEKVAALLYGEGQGPATWVKIVRPPEFWPMPIKDLADIVEGMAAGGYTEETIRNAIRIAIEGAKEWKPAGGAELLDAAYTQLRRFVKITEAQARAVILWVAAAFIYRQWDHTSYIHIWSGRIGEGKSRLRRVLQALLGVKNAYIRPSLSALFTDLEVHPGRIQVIDELDKMFNGRNENDAPILAYFTAGFEEGQTVPRTIMHSGENGGREVQEFETFCPKILCGRYGQSLDDAVRDRCVPVRMRKATWTDHVKAWVKKFHWAETEAIGARLRVWCESIAAEAGQIDIYATDAVDFRVIDIWEPQLAVAEVASEETRNADPAAVTWLDWAKWSMVKQHLGAEGEHDSADLRLLKTIFTIYKEHVPSEGIFSDQLESEIRALGEEWMEYGKTGRPITKRRIANILAKTYEILPERITLDDKRERGYEWAWFAKAFKTWLGVDISVQVLASTNSLCPALCPEDIPLTDKELQESPDVRTQVGGGVSVHPREELDKMGLKWFKLSELRAMKAPEIQRLGEKARDTYGIAMTRLGTWIPCFILERPGGRSYETTMLDSRGVESRPASQSGAQQAIWRPGGVEWRKR